ncbi:sulfite oxidase [Rhodotorula toruloides]|uniref:Nitrate reductase [NADPH] n=1 Tax=Rhodotorula toruloides TaxID=5286 RepID=A0A511KRG3_RHOTO|nr:sulfite oxidase [Rhodotorula toruloides]
MPHRQHRVVVSAHPGSSAQEIADEPDWSGGHQHRVGFRNRDDRLPGLAPSSSAEINEAEHEHERERHEQDVAHAKAQLETLGEERSEGRLVNFREIVERQEDLHLRYPTERPIGWRYVLNETEDWVKNKQDWPANVKRRSQQEQQEQQQGKDEKEHEGNEPKKESKPTEKKQQGPRNDDEDGSKGGDDGDKLHKQRSPREQALLENLKGELEYVAGLQINDGSGRAMPRGLRNRTDISIDEQDQFSPDNWLPRASGLVRLTGKNPLNAEPHLTGLFEAGLITPNELHYVRNHGSVPRILWEMHRVDVEVDHDLGLGPGARLSLSMDDIKDGYKAVSFPVYIACDGNRRKELNMIRKGKGFNWGAGAVGCAYWKGTLLRDVLASAGVVPDELDTQLQSRQLWVNFAGQDELSEGTYETCLPLAYAMNLHNDVLLAYEMNGVNLPPDHGYPVRLVVPGFVGGRCVKWLRRIWITERENSSHYHIWDNRVVPAFVRSADKDDPVAHTMFHHPDTKCNEQNLNSVIVRPQHGETVSFGSVAVRRSYRIQGYAYDGGGLEVQRVEVSLDGGDEWLYCVRTFPDQPVRHGTKFWTWLHWHVDVDMAQLLNAKSITVRAFNATKNTQPERPVWNVMGMMNNCWYVVRSEVQQQGQDCLSVVFRHPVEPGAGEGGWMQPSEENKIAQAKQEAGTPEKQFTREEIEKHGRADDCWIVVDGKVYDATSVLDWHPGGKAAILSHAGKVHQQTTDEFASIHDDYAHRKLKDCILGSVTDKAKQFIKRSAEAAAKEAAASGSDDADHKLALKKHRWVPVRLLDRRDVSHDTRRYTFQMPAGKDTLGLGTCQHVLIGFHMPDRMLIQGGGAVSDIEEERAALEDGQGTFDLTVKTYFPDANQPGGALSNILDCIPIGEDVEMRGPTGDIVYEGNGTFTLGEGQQRHFSRVSLVLGGSGITPGFALIARILLSPNDDTQLRVVDANKSEDDILMRAELDHFEKEAKEGQLHITHVLSHPANDEWTGRRGHVDADLLRDALFPPDEDSVVLLCGPPAMIQKAALPALRDWGYVEDENMFGF